MNAAKDGEMDNRYTRISKEHLMPLKIKGHGKRGVSGRKVRGEMCEMCMGKGSLNQRLK